MKLGSMLNVEESNVAACICTHTHMRNTHNIIEIWPSAIISKLQKLSFFTCAVSEHLLKLLLMKHYGSTEIPCLQSRHHFSLFFLWKWNWNVINPTKIMTHITISFKKKKKKSHVIYYKIFRILFSHLIVRGSDYFSKAALPAVRTHGSVIK